MLPLTCPPLPLYTLAALDKAGLSQHAQLAWNINMTSYLRALEMTRDGQPPKCCHYPVESATASRVLEISPAILQAFVEHQLHARHTIIQWDPNKQTNIQETIRRKLLPQVKTYTLLGHTRKWANTMWCAIYCDGEGRLYLQNSEVVTKPGLGDQERLFC